MTIYFNLAASIVRAHEARRRRDAAIERCCASIAKQAAHMRRVEPLEIAGPTQAEIDAEMLALLNRAEARAINGESQMPRICPAGMEGSTS